MVDEQTATYTSDDLVGRDPAFRRGWEREVSASPSGEVQSTLQPPEKPLISDGATEREKNNPAYHLSGREQKVTGVASAKET
jgi:hypothetical protein